MYIAVQFALLVRVVLAVSYVVLAVSPMWLSLSNLLWFVRSVLRVSMRAARACVGACLCARLHACVRVCVALLDRGSAGVVCWFVVLLVCSDGL